MKLRIFPPRMLPAASAFAAVAFTCTFAPAQTANSLPSHAPTISSEDDTPVVLSPFEVRTDQESGYVATQTLAGTRIASDIKNLAAQITVMTPEFLADIGAVSLDEAELYSLNVENHQEYSNDAVADGAAGVENLNGAQRVRGLANATNTRDFFSTFFALDTYNCERFTFNSGPNAILFGLGSPGGVIDQSLRRARFMDSAQVGLRIDNQGSYRTQFDVNRVLISSVLAVRTDFLYDHEESWKQPSRDLQRRQYVTATYRPFKSTTVRVSYENIRREAAIPRNTLLKDFVTPYLDWRGERMQSLGISDPLDPRLYWAPSTQLNGGESPFATGAGTPFAPLSSQSLRLLTGQVSPDTPAAALLNRIAGTVSASNPIGASVISRGPHEDMSVPDDFNYSLTDASIFPYDINPGGLATDNHQKGNILNMFIEQQITKDFVVEAAFQRERYDQVYSDYIRGTDQKLYIDVNRYIPNITDQAGHPVLNPNRGKYYMESWGRGSVNYGHTESARLTASYHLDFTKKSGWWRWLGTYNFAGLLDLNRSLTGAQNQRSLLFSTSTDVNIRNPSNHSDRQIYYRVYLDAPGEGTSFYDVNSAVTTLGGEPYGPAHDASVALRPSDPSQGVWSAGTITRDETFGRMFALQSLFWDGRIAVTYGRRGDTFRSKTATTPRIDPDSPASTRPWNWNNFIEVQTIAEPSLDDQLDLDESGSQETRGIVVTPYPFVSVFYNTSANRQAGSPGINPNGGFSQPSSGEGKDYGVAFYLLDSRIHLKLNWYENNQTRNPSSEFASLKFPISALEARLDDLGEEYLSIGYHPSPTWFPARDVQRTAVLSDLAAKGLEVTLTANPLHNWRVSLSAAKMESVETNIAQEWYTYVAARTPEWTKFYDYARNEGGDVSQGAQTIKGWIDSEIMFPYLDRAKLLEGRPSEQVRKWRVNFVTNYDFTAGWLRNIGVGGAVRWRDRAAIGFPLLTLPDGSTIQDVNNPWYDNGLTDIDGWLSYKMKMWNDKVRVRFQLNVRNIFDSQKLLPQRASTTGAPVLFTAQAPRQFIFSANFDL